jgi:predicted RNase H-like HicB family nuclease
MAQHYLVIIERGIDCYGAYVPDLPGCVAVADTEDEVKELIDEAIQIYIETLIEKGEQIPEPKSESFMSQVA